MSRPKRPTPRKSMIGFTLPQFPGMKLMTPSRRVGGGHMIRRQVGEVFQPTKTPFTMRREQNRRRDKIAANSRRRNRPRR